MEGQILLAIVAFMLALLSGFMLGSIIQNSWWKKLCIRKGFARYNETTGEWEWKL